MGSESHSRGEARHKLVGKPQISASSAWLGKSPQLAELETLVQNGAGFISLKGPVDSQQLQIRQQTMAYMDGN